MRNLFWCRWWFNDVLKYNTFTNNKTNTTLGTYRQCHYNAILNKFLIGVTGNNAIYGHVKFN